METALLPALEKLQAEVMRLVDEVAFLSRVTRQLRDEAIAAQIAAEKEK